MARRLFFVPAVRREQAELEGEAAQHLVRVLRVEEGQLFEISDNHHRYLAEITTARKSQVVFSVREKLEDPPPVPDVTLLASLFKFDHFEWMLEKAAELNVARIIPVVSERSEKGLDQAAPKRMDRWQRILLESSQQCRRAILPELLTPAKLKEVHGFPGTQRIILDELRQGPPLAGLRVRPEDSMAILLGPEGGWADRERSDALASGWSPRSLGPNILRAETAAIAALATVTQLYMLERPE